MIDKNKISKTGPVPSDATRAPDPRKRPPALWLGPGQGHLEMGWGRGPQVMEGHELVSWFFSRDGI